MMHELLPSFLFDKNAAYILFSYGIVIAGLLAVGYSSFKNVKQQLQRKPYE